jgi:hypothetical protein
MATNKSEGSEDRPRPSPSAWSRRRPVPGIVVLPDRVTLRARRRGHGQYPAVDRGRLVRVDELVLQPDFVILVRRCQMSWSLLVGSSAALRVSASQRS